MDARVSVTDGTVTVMARYMRYVGEPGAELRSPTGATVAVGDGDLFWRGRQFVSPDGYELEWLVRRDDGEVVELSPESVVEMFEVVEVEDTHEVWGRWNG